MLAEEERLEKLEKERVEKESVKKEKAEFIKRLNAVKGKFREAGSLVKIRNTLSMFQDLGEGNLSLMQFTKAMRELRITV